MKSRLPFLFPLFFVLVMFTGCPMEFYWLGREEYKTVDISDKVSVALLNDAESFCVNEAIGISVEYTLDPKEYEYGYKDGLGSETESMDFRIQKQAENDFENYYEFSCMRNSDGDAVIDAEKNQWKASAVLQEWNNEKQKGSFSLSFPEAGEYLVSYTLHVRSSEESERYGGGICEGALVIKIRNEKISRQDSLDVSFINDAKIVSVHESVSLKMTISSIPENFDSSGFILSVYKMDGSYFEEFGDFYFDGDTNSGAVKTFHEIFSGTISVAELPSETVLSFLPVSEGEYLVDAHASTYTVDSAVQRLDKGFLFTVE